jgi:hypothetical protein
MPKLSDSNLPKYCRLNDRNIAFYWRDGKRVYLPGHYGSPESKEAYNKQMASLLDHRNDEVVEKKKLRSCTIKDITVAEIIARFLQHAEVYYVKNGKQTDTAYQYKVATQPIMDDEKFCGLQASKFTQSKLKSIQEKMVDSGLARKTVNARIDKIKTVFKWAVGEELIEPEVHLKLKYVQGLQKSRTKAPEKPKRKPVADWIVEAT